MLYDFNGKIFKVRKKGLFSNILVETKMICLEFFDVNNKTQDVLIKAFDLKNKRIMYHVILKKMENELLIQDKKSFKPFNPKNYHKNLINKNLIF